MEMEQSIRGFHVNLNLGAHVNLNLGAHVNLNHGAGILEHESMVKAHSQVARAYPIVRSALHVGMHR